MNTTPSGSIDSATQDRQRSAASSVSSGRSFKPYKQQQWADERIDMTPLGLVSPSPSLCLCKQSMYTQLYQPHPCTHLCPLP